MEPVCSTYYVAEGTVKSVGHLCAASLCNFGPVPNFLCEWVYDFIIGGPKEVYKKLPVKLLGCKNELGDTYEKVYIHTFCFFYGFLLRNVEKL